MSLKDTPLPELENLILKANTIIAENQINIDEWPTDKSFKIIQERLLELKDKITKELNLRIHESQT